MRENGLHHGFQLLPVGPGGDFESKFITHWDGGQQGHFMDLRYPGGQRAFHTLPSDTRNANVDGYIVSDRSYTLGDVSAVTPPDQFIPGKLDASRILGFLTDVILPYDQPNRRQLAARIANDPSLIAERISIMLEAITVRVQKSLEEGKTYEL